MSSVPGKFLNSTNIVKKVFDEENDAIRVSSPGITEVVIDAASGDNIAIKHSDGGDITPARPLPVSIDQITIAEVEIKNDIGNPVPISTVNGALETTQQNVLSELQTIDTSLNNIEGDTVLIKNAVQSLDTDIDVTLSTRSSELTQQQVLAETVLANASLDAIEADADAIRLAVQSIDADFDVALSTRATEATQLDNKTELQAINAELDAQTVLLTSIDQSTNNIELATESLDTKIDVNLSTRNAEATQQLVFTELQTANLSLDNVEADTDSIRIAIQSIDTDFDVLLSSRASEATQVLNNSELISINSELDTQTAVLNTIDTSLNDIETRLETFDTNTGLTTVNTLRTSSNITDETGSAFTDLNYVPVGQTTHDNLNVNANMQVNNTDASNSNPVPVSDAGGSLTVDANNLDIRDLVFTTDKVDTTGSVHQNKVLISTLNSTNTPLAANTTFTGTWELLGNYVSMSLLVNSDSLAATDTIRVDFSTNGIDVDKTIAIDMIAGGDYCSLGAESAYYRVRITSGSTPQTFLRAQTILSSVSEGNKYSPLIDSLTDSSSALLTRAVIMGKTTGGGGGYVAVKVNPSGALTGEVTVTASALPTGAATAANQVTAQASLTSIDNKLTAPLIVSGQSAVGTIPTNNPVSVSGVDDLGFKRALKVNSQGRLETTLPNDYSRGVFGGARVVTTQNVFESLFSYDKQPTIWDEVIVSGGSSTWNGNTNSIDMTVNTVPGASVIRQTFRRIRYNPSRATQIIAAASLGIGKTNVRKRIGQFDDANGLFFEQDGTTVYVVRRSSTSGSPVDTKVAQANWNIDTFTGLGGPANPSGIAIDFSKHQAFFIQYAFQGFADITYGFYLNGQIVFCHKETTANVLANPFMTSAHLPCRVEITNIGVTTSATNMSYNSFTGKNEGEDNETEGQVRSYSNAPIKSIRNVVVPVLSVRLGTGYEKAIADILSTTIFVQTADEVIWSVWLSPTLTGATFAITASYTQIDTAATAMTGGIELISGILSQANTSTSVSQDLLKLVNSLIGASINGTSQIITLAARSRVGSADILSSLVWREYP